MGVHIIFGWWLLPFIITVAAFCAAYLTMRNDPQAAMFGPVMWLLLNEAALIVSLIAWLVWSIAV